MYPNPLGKRQLFCEILQLGLDKAVLAHARNEAQQGAELDGDEDGRDGRAQSASGMISTRGTGKVSLLCSFIESCQHI